MTKPKTYKDLSSPSPPNTMTIPNVSTERFQRAHQLEFPTFSDMSHGNRAVFMDHLKQRIDASKLSNYTITEDHQLSSRGTTTRYKVTVPNADDLKKLEHILADVNKNADRNTGLKIDRPKDGGASIPQGFTPWETSSRIGKESSGSSSGQGSYSQQQFGAGMSSGERMGMQQFITEATIQAGGNNADILTSLSKDGRTDFKVVAPDAVAKQIRNIFDGLAAKGEPPIFTKADEAPLPIVAPPPVELRRASLSSMTRSG